MSQNQNPVLPYKTDGTWALITFVFPFKSGIASVKSKQGKKNSKTLQQVIKHDLQFSNKMKSSSCT